MVITQEGNLVRNKMGHCDNPRGGIYNPYQIKKKTICLSGFLGGFLHYTLGFLFSLCNKTMCVITTSAADKPQNLSFRQVKSHQTVSCSHRNCLKHWRNTIPPSLLWLWASPEPNLTGHLSYTNPVNLSKTMPCWWWSLKTSGDNGSNTNREALNYCCNSLSFYCSCLPRPSAPRLLLVSPTEWKCHILEEEDIADFPITYLWPK